MKILIPLFSVLALPTSAFSWGSEGHKIVAQVAAKKLNTGIQATVQKYLGTTTFDQAATWMDDVRSDHTFDYMKLWHYTNIDSGGTYQKSPKGDVVSELQDVIADLKGYKTMKPEDVEKDLKILFHLCGDITQPLHDGYGNDLGGNKVDVTLDGKKTNLHHVWDTDIIKNKGITVDACLTLAGKWSTKDIECIEAIDPLAWMTDARSYLPQVYNFKDATITQEYIDRNEHIVETQIAKGGLRLAAVLNEIFSGE